MKNSAQEFVVQQKEVMEMMSEMTRNVYSILENMAQKEIEDDPLAYIRRESL